MTQERQERLQKLQDLVIDNAIKELENNSIPIKDMGAIITLLKNNQVLEEKPKGQTEAELIDELVQEIDDDDL